MTLRRVSGLLPIITTGGFGVVHFLKIARSASLLMATLIASLGGVAQAQDRQYHFQLSVSPGPYPTIRGLTDMPDGTKLLVTVMKPHLPDGQQRLARGLPACDEMCGPARILQTPYVDPVVKNGIFIAGPFSFGDQPFEPDIYPVRISVVPEQITQAGLDAMNRPVYMGEIQMPRSDMEIWTPGGDKQSFRGKRENWQSVRLPPNLNGTMYAYDKNSISFTRNARGEIAGAEMAVRVIRGDESLLGKQALFSFFCDGSGLFRINHSYPISVESQLPTQEGQLANIACGAAQCEIFRQRSNGQSVCSGD
jgi:hypothetical protein